MLESTGKGCHVSETRFVRQEIGILVVGAPAQYKHQLVLKRIMRKQELGLDDTLEMLSYGVISY